MPDSERPIYRLTFIGADGKQHHATHHSSFYNAKVHREVLDPSNPAGAAMIELMRRCYSEMYAAMGAKLVSIDGIGTTSYEL
jgi:hypothetical protein